MSDYAIQRKNMVESQIRPSDVTDRRIIRAMGTVAREAFVPPTSATLAYMDDAVPLGPAHTRGAAPRMLMSPRTFAKLLVLADVKETDRVLTVGCGMGYSAAVISALARSVVALESDAGLVATARTALAGLEAETASRIALIEGPLNGGAPDRAPFDVIVLEGAVPERPSILAQQLADGGRCVGVVRRGAVGCATLWRRVGAHLAEADAFEATVADLPGFSRPATFAL
ncbi:MAG: protein-L-isoaspartate O-methyltransferase [Hyphomicrobiaceae bacterium]|nr:protein-L-isoaspartate O-methyltransferase [Hyphomicrobiaceae bacterium]